jgi:hypothetical protein
MDLVRDHVSSSTRMRRTPAGRQLAPWNLMHDVTPRRTVCGSDALVLYAQASNSRSGKVIWHVPGLTPATRA